MLCYLLKTDDVAEGRHSMMVNATANKVNMAGKQTVVPTSQSNSAQIKMKTDNQHGSYTVSKNQIDFRKNVHQPAGGLKPLNSESSAYHSVPPGSLTGETHIKGVTTKSQSLVEQGAVAAVAGVVPASSQNNNSNVNNRANS